MGGGQSSMSAESDRAALRNAAEVFAMREAQVRYRDNPRTAARNRPYIP